jgi:hypothetical protein
MDGKMPKKAVAKGPQPKTLKVKKKIPKKALPYKGWSPLKDGISQSLLQKFIVDTDRAHKHTVLGLRSTDRKEAMEYGSIFHKLIEVGAKLGPKYTRDKMVKFMQVWMKKRYPSTESALLARIALVQYHLYREWESKRLKHKYIEAEPVFNEKYTLPALNFNPCQEISIRTKKAIIPLRGRIDGVLDIDGGMWIEENKTKGRIDISFLQDTIPENIQVMFYAICSQLKYGKPCKGVMYNVIRKPGQRQRKTESDIDFLKRIQGEIEADPNYYFYRLSHSFAPGAVAKWEREELQPLLYTIYLWWRSIEANPTNPWVDLEGNLNPFHGRRSFGVYDPLSEGKGDFFDLIVYGRNKGLTTTTEMFPELQDDEEDALLL